jgi:Tol biopolymer transport system component
MDRDGRNQHRLIDGEGWDPTWSPDGRQILYASDRGSSTQLWLVGMDGSGLRKVSDLPAIRGRSDWSPDGRFIVTDSGGSWDHEIYLMNADGSNAADLRETPGCKLSDINGWRSGLLRPSRRSKWLRSISCALCVTCAA